MDAEDFRQVRDAVRQLVRAVVVPLEERIEAERYITNAPITDLFVVFAPSDPAAEGGRGISSFVVDARTPGCPPTR